VPRSRSTVHRSSEASNLTAASSVNPFDQVVTPWSGLLPYEDKVAFDSIELGRLILMRLSGSVKYVRDGLLALRLWFLRKVMKMDIHPSVQISLKANLDMTNPTGVHVDEGTYIAFHAVVLAHDMSRLLMTDTYIGRNCFIGAYSIILPGVRVVDGCIVGSGSVVTSDVPSHCIVAGNPAKIIRSGIRTRSWGILEDAYAKVEAVKGTEQAKEPGRNAEAEGLR
jgi:acetyltransferase-like isoleucine patch superfamily enzyme